MTSPHHQDRSKSMSNEESTDTTDTSSSSSRTYIVMDDRLYEAARVKGNYIPSFITGNEIFKSRTRGEERNNMFHVAALYGNEGFIREVLGDNQHHFYSLIYEKNSKGETPLHLAAQFGHMKTVEALLDAHGDTSYWSEKDKHGDTPLHVALRYAHQDIAILLVQRDANLLSIDNQAGESPAYLAAKNLCERFFRKILDDEGYDQISLSFSGPFGMTAFHPARILNDDILLTLMRRREELLGHQDNKGKTILHYVVEDNIEPMVEFLLKIDSSLACLFDNDGMTPLHIACNMGSFPMIRVILELSPQSISMVCKTGVYKGKTALHVAKMDVGFLRVCLRHTRLKELINVTDNEGNTPLHLALKNSGDLDIADALLVAGGIDWRLKNSDGFTPMDLRKSNRKILSSKLDTNIEVDRGNGKAENVDGCTPINLCDSEDKISSELERLTSEYWRVKQEVNTQLLSDFNISLDRLMGSNREDVFTSWRGVEGESIAHLAAREGHMGIINKAAHEWDCKSRVLVLSGENSRGEIPLHAAAAFGELAVVDAILELSISTDKLGNKKPEKQLGVVVEPIQPPNHDQDHHNNDNSGVVDFYVNSHSEWKPWRSKSTNGDTPVHVALRNGHEKIAMCLLKWDPRLILSFVNKANESLLYLAAHGGYDAIIDHMLSEDSKSISASGPRGQNALHAIVRSPQEKKGSADCNLMRKLPRLLINVDSDGKTPLHNIVESGCHFNLLKMIDEDDGTPATLMYDNEGFTPLLRAAANGYYDHAFHMIRCCPYSVQLRHAHNEKTILHLLKVMSVRSLKKWKELFKRKPQIAKLVNETDKEGNTPLHCAILESDIYKADLLLSIKGVRQSIQNKQQHTPMNLCKQLREKGDSKQFAIRIALEDAIAREEERPSQVPLLARINTSVMMSYGCQRMSSDENLKKLLENVAVAAALLITLTFAATFTIPGGYDGDTGQALRMKEASVKVFVSSNVVAMLLGVGVLLTYTFGATKQTWLRVLSIPCVVMLQCALFATIVSFISGVYALVSQDAKWIATLAVVIVGGVLLLFSITPAAAEVVSQILNLFQNCLKWLRKAGTLLLLIIPYFLAKPFGQEAYFVNLAKRLA